LRAHEFVEECRRSFTPVKTTFPCIRWVKTFLALNGGKACRHRRRLIQANWPMQTAVKGWRI
jgi:hypothetical protein